MPCHPALRALPRVVAAVLTVLAFAAHADPAAEIRTLVGRGDLPAALARADKALAARPQDAPLQFLHAVVLMEMRQDEQALAEFTRLSQRYPELPDPFNNIALLQARAGQLELARQALDTALRNDPTHRAARLNLGQVYLMLAAQTWELAAASAPLEAETRLRLQAVQALIVRPGVAGGRAGGNADAAR